MTNEMGLIDRVFFHGHRPTEEMPALFSKASALIVTLKKNDYISYTLPGKVQSYMAAGKPMIGAIDGETRRIIEECGCGLCCEAENYQELSQLIRKFISEPWKINSYSANSFRYYKDNFSKPVFMERLNAMLQNLCH